MKGIKKENLPSKVCGICSKPFSWRKSGRKIGIVLSIAAIDAELQKRTNEK